MTIDDAPPECSRLVNEPSLYGILIEHNAGANREHVRIAQHAQYGSYNILLATMYAHVGKNWPIMLLK